MKGMQRRLVRIAVASLGSVIEKTGMKVDGMK